MKKDYVCVGVGPKDIQDFQTMIIRHFDRSECDQQLALYRKAYPSVFNATQKLKEEK